SLLPDCRRERIGRRARLLSEMREPDVGQSRALPRDRRPVGRQPGRPFASQAQHRHLHLERPSLGSHGARFPEIHQKHDRIARCGTLRPRAESRDLGRCLGGRPSLSWAWPIHYIYPPIMHRFANPGRFLRLAALVLPWSTAATILFIGVGLIWGLFFAPPDYQQGASVRILYVTVPASWFALFIYI